MIPAFAPLHEALARNRGVRGSLIVSEHDGLVVDASLRLGTGHRADHVAALAASVYRRMRLAAGAARFGEPSFLQLDAERGYVCAVGRGDLVLVVVAEPAANIGLIRVEMQKAVEALA